MAARARDAFTPQLGVLLRPHGFEGGVDGRAGVREVAVGVLGDGGVASRQEALGPGAAEVGVRCGGVEVG